MLNVAVEPSLPPISSVRSEIPPTTIEPCSAGSVFSHPANDNPTAIKNSMYDILFMFRERNFYKNMNKSDTKQNLFSSNHYTDVILSEAKNLFQSIRNNRSFASLRMTSRHTEIICIPAASCC